MKRKEVAPTISAAKPPRMSIPLDTGYQKELTAAMVRGEQKMKAITGADRKALRNFPPARQIVKP